MVAIAMPALCRAVPMASWARLDRRWGSPANQSRAWVSSTITCSASLALPILERSDGAYDVANDLHFSRHVAEDIVDQLFGGDEFDYGFAVLGDHDRLPGLRHLVHDGQAFCLELACCYPLHCMVILL